MDRRLVEQAMAGDRSAFDELARVWCSPGERSGEPFPILLAQASHLMP